MRIPFSPHSLLIGIRGHLLARLHFLSWEHLLTWAFGSISFQSKLNLMTEGSDGRLSVVLASSNHQHQERTRDSLPRRKRTRSNWISLKGWRKETVARKFSLPKER